MDKKLFRTVIATSLIIIAVSVFYYLVIFLPKKNAESIASKTIDCAKLYELKKVKYWKDDIGQTGYIYNQNLDTCLAYNIYNDFDTRDYFASVHDLTDDSSLLWYSLTPKGYYFENDQKITCEYQYDYFEYMQNGEEIKEYGCEKYGLLDKMFEKIRSYGFVVFDGFNLE